MTGPDGGVVPSAHPTRDRRIRRRAEFLRIQQHGCRVTSKHFVFLLAQRDTPGPARLGITVTRKVGVAVVRNRAKRLLREVFRSMPELLPPGVDMVVIVRSLWAGAKMSDVLTEWRGVARIITRQAAHALRHAPPPAAGAT